MRIRLDRRSLLKGWRRWRFYAGGFTRYYLPSGWIRAKFRRQLKYLGREEREYCLSRVNYYVNLPRDARLNDATAVAVADFKYPFGKKKKWSGYFFDLFEIVRIGDPDARFNYLFGDIDYTTPEPAFVKSRPITDGPTLSVLTKLDSVRHFAFLHDSRRYLDKKDMLVFRNVVRNQPWRTRFLELYHNHPLVDAGQVNNDYIVDPAYVKPFISIEGQLEYKFICCIEGHDVATNLKWVMSSNSIAVMPRPRIESWFMEGTLIPDFHYIEVKADYSDVEEKLRYYIDHPEEAEAIIRHAHEYCRQFRTRRRELLIGRMVAQRYFQLTNHR